MGYARALEKAWDDIDRLSDERRFNIRFMAETYDITCDARTVLSRPGAEPAKDFTAIVLLHYLIKRLTLAILPEPSGQWIDFRELEGGEAYYPVFKKRTIDRVAGRFGKDPERLVSSVERAHGYRTRAGDAGAIIQPLDAVPLLIELWAGDDEFGPSANILFDRTIPIIFCTEDTVIMTETAVHALRP